MKSISHETTSGETPSKFGILSCVKPSHFKFVTQLRSSRQKVYCEKDVLRNFTKFTGKHCVRVPFLIKLQEVCNFIKKETLAQVFSCEFCEISQKTFPYRTPLVAASVNSCHFPSLIYHDCSLKFSKQKVNYFEPFHSSPKGI